MSYDDSTHYWQVGWVKQFNHPGPDYFVEYGCPTVCDFPYTPTPGTHLYRTEFVSPNWCAYIDGVQYLCRDVSVLGMAAAANVEFRGETSDTKADLGGTTSNHLRMYQVGFKDALQLVWFQMNTTGMINILTPGTRYADALGYTDPYVWVENWTVR